MAKNFKISLILFIVLLLCPISRIYAYQMRYPFRDDNDNDKIILKTENFGAYRKYPKNGYEELHTGVDLSTSRNTKV